MKEKRGEVRDGERGSEVGRREVREERECEGGEGERERERGGEEEEERGKAMRAE